MLVELVSERIERTSAKIGKIDSLSSFSDFVRMGGPPSPYTDVRNHIKNSYDRLIRLKP